MILQKQGIHTIRVFPQNLKSVKIASNTTETVTINVDGNGCFLMQLVLKEGGYDYLLIIDGEMTRITTEQAQTIPISPGLPIQERFSKYSTQIL